MVASRLSVGLRGASNGRSPGGGGSRAFDLPARGPRQRRQGHVADGVGGGGEAVGEEGAQRLDRGRSEVGQELGRRQCRGRGGDHRRTVVHRLEVPDLAQVGRLSVGVA